MCIETLHDIETLHATSLQQVILSAVTNRSTRLSGMVVFISGHNF